MFSIDITLSTATLKPDAHSEYVSAALKPGPRREYFRNMSIHRLTQRYWGAASNSDTRVETSDVLFNNVKLTILLWLRHEPLQSLALHFGTNSFLLLDPLY